MIARRPRRLGPRQSLTVTGLVALLLTTFVGYLDTFIVNVAGPSIQSQLGASFTEVQFIISGYTAAYATGLVLGGRLGDVFGHGRMWKWGTASFVIASVICGVAPDAVFLIIARVVQGFTASVVLPQILAIIRLTSGPGDRQRRRLAVYGIVAGLAALSGQLIGGALIGFDLAGLGWRAIFLVNVPTGVIAFLVGLHALPQTGRLSHPRLDVLGAALLTLAVGAGLSPLIAQSGSGWSAPQIALLLLGVTAAVIFVAHERRIERVDPDRPILRLSLLRLASLRWGMAIVVSYFGGNAGLFLGLAYYLQSGLGENALSSGLTFVPLGAGFILASALTAHALRRWSTRVLVVGAALVLASLPLLILAVLSGHQRSLIMAALFVNGVGEGFLDVPLFGIVLSRVGDDVAGAASGLLLTATQIAAVLSVALTGAIFAGVSPGPGGPSLAPRADARHAYATSFVVSLVWLCVLALATLAMVIAADRHPAVSVAEPAPEGDPVAA